MESRRRFSFRKVFSLFYALAFAVYLIIGLQPAGARKYEISGSLSIPSINLESDVTSLRLENHKLDTPDTIVGSYVKNENKTFLIGHSTTVFKNLNQVSIGDTIYYNDKTYQVINKERQAKTDVDMDKILAREEKDTLIIMTCAGKILDNGDATHRFIVTAIKI